METFAHEQAMYETLNENPHNILQSFLRTAHGIFLPRMNQDLRSRLRQSNIAEAEQYRWVAQVSCAAGLEVSTTFMVTCGRETSHSMLQAMSGYATSET